VRDDHHLLAQRNFADPLTKLLDAHFHRVIP
jgi:hypothetical protein